MEENEALFVDQLNHLKDELKLTRNDITSLNEMKNLMKPAFIKLINEITWT